MDKIIRVVLVDDMGKTLTFTEENKLNVKVVKDANNALEIKEGGLSVDLSTIKEQLEALQAELDKEIGVAKAFPTTEIPDGYLPMEGQEFDTNQYPKLAKVYPTGKLPDLRGMFIRGSNGELSVGDNSRDDYRREPLTFQAGTLVLGDDTNYRVDEPKVVSFTDFNSDTINADTISINKKLYLSNTHLNGQILISEYSGANINRQEVDFNGSGNGLNNSLGVCRPTNIAFKFACRAG